jgi:hypothetical protein
VFPTNQDSDSNRRVIKAKNIVDAQGVIPQDVALIYRLRLTPDGKAIRHFFKKKDYKRGLAAFRKY